MTSFRLFKYSEQDLSLEKKSEFIQNLKKFDNTFPQLGWCIPSRSINENLESGSISFKVEKREIKEILTLEGLREFDYIEQYPIVAFLNQNIIAIGKGISVNIAEEVKGCVEHSLFDNGLSYISKLLHSNEELLNKLEEDDDVEVRGFDSRNAMGIDRVSGLDRNDIRNTQLYEDASRGIFTAKTYAKVFPYPLGKIKFCLKSSGLIVIFKKNFSAEESAVVLNFLLNYLEKPKMLSRTLASFV